jgi:hypothetical protein
VSTEHTVVDNLRKEINRFRRGEDVTVNDILAMTKSQKLGGLAALLKAVNDVTPDSTTCGKIFLVRDKTNNRHTSVVIQLRFGLPGV